MSGFIAEIKEEFYDFIDDFGDLIKKRPPKKEVFKKEIIIGGQLTLIRPAYLFAERIENLVKILFGLSVLVSAVTSSIVGFSSLSGLIEVLVKTFIGRAVMFLIGSSYLVVAIWKTLHLGKSTTSKQ